MNPTRVDRRRLRDLTDLPNVGPVMAGALRSVGVLSPSDLVGADAFDLFERCAAVTGRHQDFCLLDVLLSVVDFMQGGEPRAWWTYTPERKRLVAALADSGKGLPAGRP